MIHIPLAATASQTLSVTVGGQPAKIAVRRIGDSLYFTLLNGTVPIVTNRICRNLQRLLLDAQYQPFVGDFFFNDAQGDTDPNYQGLDTRYFLYYITPAELT